MTPFRRRLCVALTILAWLAPALALTIPPAPPRFVHDDLGILDPGGRHALEERLMQLNRERGLQIGVAILPSLEGGALEESSLAIAESWQPGFANRDDGLLIAVFLEERKLRIEVGYGLEGAIPDIIAGRIIREQIAPAFRSQRYAQGLINAVDALAAAAAGETLPPPAESRNTKRRAARGTALIAQLIFVLIILIIARSGRGRGLGGGASALPWWLLLLYGGRRRGGGSGSWGGGGSFGGGSFGGGSFGGGGASGGW